MKVLLINASDETVLNGGKGGNQLLTETLYRSLQRHTNHTINLELLPFDDRSLTGLYRTYKRALSYDASAYDAVISMKFPSYCVSHENHLCLFNHRKKQFYSEWDDFKGKNWVSSLFKNIRERIHRVDYNALSQTRILAQSQTIANRLRQSGLYSNVLHPPPQLTDMYSKTYDYIFLPSRLEDANKRISLAIHAANKANNVNLVVTGDGPDRDRLEKIAHENTVSFTGFVSKNRLKELYAKARAVLFLGEEEDYGLTTVEAMKATKPVITCVDSGGPLDLVENKKTGYVTNPRIQDLTPILEHVQQHPRHCKELGQNAKERVTTITWSNYTAAITDHLQELKRL